MWMTRAEVEQVVFGGSLRGYDRDEVDAFLDRVASAIGHLQDDAARLRRDLAAATERAERAERLAAGIDATIARRVDEAVRQTLNDDEP